MPSFLRGPAGAAVGAAALLSLKRLSGEPSAFSLLAASFFAGATGAAGAGLAGAATAFFAAGAAAVLAGAAASFFAGAAVSFFASG